MISKFIRKISGRNSNIHERPNRNESGIEKIIDVYVTYYDALDHLN